MLPSVKSLTVMALALALMGLTQGCQLALIPAMYAVGKAQERAAVKKTLETAPETGNPSKTNQIEDVPSVGSRGTQFRPVSYTAEAMCFEFTGGQSPQAVQQASYDLLSFRSSEE